MNLFDEHNNNDSSDAQISLHSGALNNTDGSNTLWKNNGKEAILVTRNKNHNNDCFGHQPISRMRPPSLIQGRQIHHPSSSNLDNHSNSVKATEEKVLVQHNYCDYAMVSDDEKRINTKGGVKVPFPIKLFNMLEHIDLQEPRLSSVISWQPHGRCFLAHDQKRCEELVLPRFFNQKHYSSFRRQLNLWGFKRITQSGPDNGAYYHELFLRSKTFLCRGINRTTPGGTGLSSIRVPSNPEAEPKFYSMMVLPPSGPSSSSSNSANIDIRSAVSPASNMTGPSNTFNESFVFEKSVPQCLESTQPLLLGDQNLNLNLDADVVESPVSSINNFFDNHFVPHRSNRHLDDIDPLPLPQDGASRQPLDASDAKTLQLLDTMRASILARHGLCHFETTSGRNTGMPRFQGFSDRHQLLVNNRNQQGRNLGGMNQQHPAEATARRLSALGDFGSSSSLPNFQQHQLRMRLPQERHQLHRSLYKSEGDNTSNNELAPIESFTSTKSLSQADKSLLLDMLQGQPWE